MVLREIDFRDCTAIFRIIFPLNLVGYSGLSILLTRIVRVGKRMVKQTAEDVEEDRIENNDNQEKTVVRLYFVQRKSLQKCSIINEDAAILPAIPPLLEKLRIAPVSVSPLMCWEIWLLAIAWSLLQDKVPPQ